MNKRKAALIYQNLSGTDKAIIHDIMSQTRLRLDFNGGNFEDEFFDILKNSEIANRHLKRKFIKVLGFGLIEKIAIAAQKRAEDANNFNDMLKSITAEIDSFFSSRVNWKISECTKYWERERELNPFEAKKEMVSRFLGKHKSGNGFQYVSGFFDIEKNGGKKLYSEQKEKTEFKFFRTANELFEVVN